MKLADLQPFCTQDEHRVSLQQPFPVGDYMVATDGRIIVRVPKIAIEDMADWKPVDGARYPTSCEEIFAQAIANSQTLGPLPELPVPAKDCPACHGSGEVLFTFRHDDERYETKAECPVCYGEGSANLSSIRVTVGVSECSLYYLRKIAAMLGATIGNGPDKMSMCLFRWDGGEGVLMPMRRE